MELIPAIDLLGGRCVRLYQGDFGQVTDYGHDPVELAASYGAAGARRLHLVDLDGARSGTPDHLDLIGRITATAGLPVQVGGGVRTRAMAEALLGAGADRVVVGSVAVRNPAEVLGWLAALGVERIVLAFDVRLPDDGGEPRTVVHGWREAGGKGLWEMMDVYQTAGARHFLCTDVGRDGTLAGPNTALYAECCRRFPGARMIASGGLASAADLPALQATGVAGVVTGKALLDGRITLEEIRKFSRAG